MRETPFPAVETLQSSEILPEGSNGEFGLPPEQRVVVVSGNGARLRTTCGTEMLDFSMGWGSVLLGHSDPGVREAVQRQAALGSNFAAINQPALRLAERLQRISPACERLRFVASGTEATLTCLRLARAWTGRPSVLKFDGAYHGSHDVGIANVFPKPGVGLGVAELGAGAAPDLHHHLIVGEYNDADGAAALIDRHADRLAAVIVEPLHRCLPPEAGFLETLREQTRRRGVLLVFDEVVTGFRLALGGAQEHYGVVPDLVAYGKAIGGGYPLGVVGGRSDILEIVGESRLNRSPPYVWMASTLGGNPISAAAANATLDRLERPGTYDQLHATGQYLRERIAAALRRTAVPGHVLGDGPLAQVLISDRPLAPRSSRDVRRSRSAANRWVMLDLFRRGVFLNPMGTKLYVSLAHDRATCDAFEDHLEQSLMALGERERAELHSNC